MRLYSYVYAILYFHLANSNNAGNVSRTNDKPKTTKNDAKQLCKRQANRKQQHQLQTVEQTNNLAEKKQTTTTKDV